VCGGSGGSFVREAIVCGADLYITGDLKYHEALENAGQISLIDVGHRASEIPVLGYLEDLLKKRFTGLKVWKFVENKDYFEYK
jgi:putative NIF3 family GTP cyclohydrolase 1 type 2